MKKAAFFIAAILVVAVIWIMNPNEPVDDVSEFTIEEISQQTCEMKNDYVGEYSLITVPQERGLGDCVVTEEYIYFLDNHVIPMADYATSCTLMEYSIESGEFTELLEIERESNLYVNELIHADGYLGWLVSYEGVAELELMKLESGEKYVFYTVDDADRLPMIFSLDGHGDYITWYEGQKTEDGETWRYMIYSISQDAVETIEDISPALSSRNPNIRKGNIVTVHYGGDHLILRKQQLLSGETLTVHLPAEIRKIQNLYANDRYIVWHTDYGESSLYVYDIEKSQLNRLSLMPRIFSIELVGQKLVVNDRRDYGLIAIDLESYDVRKIGDEILSEMTFTMDKAFAGRYMAVFNRHDSEGRSLARGIFYVSLE